MVHNFLHSIFSNVEMYINNQQTYISNGLFAYNSYIFNEIKGSNSEHKGDSYCKGNNYEEFPNETMEVLLSEAFCTRRMKMLSITDGLFLYGKLGFYFFSVFEL